MYKLAAATEFDDHAGDRQYTTSSCGRRASNLRQLAISINASEDTMNINVYAFIFGQKGLMAGLGIQGNKITKITPK